MGPWFGERERIFVEQIIRKRFPERLPPLAWARLPAG